MSCKENGIIEERTPYFIYEVMELVEFYLSKGF